VSGGMPILPWIRSSHISTRQLDDYLTTTERIVARLGNLVSQAAELRAHRLTDRRLERHPRLAEMSEARRVDRLLHVHPEHEQIDQQLSMTLRLHGAAHQPKAHV